MGSALSGQAPPHHPAVLPSGRDRRVFTPHPDLVRRVTTALRCPEVSADRPMLWDVTHPSPAHRALFSRSFRWLSLLALLALLAVLSPLTASPAFPARAAPTALPGGKSTFVVATAKLHDGKKYNNWTQLGWYLFDASRHQVRAETFVWRQDAPVKQLRREAAGTLPDAHCSGGTRQVRRCQVMTAPHYSAASSSRPPVIRTGTYLLRSDNGTTYLDIRWPRGSPRPGPSTPCRAWHASTGSPPTTAPMGTRTAATHRSTNAVRWTRYGGTSPSPTGRSSGPKTVSRRSPGRGPSIHRCTSGARPPPGV